MKQILQHMNNGTTELVEVPTPSVQAGTVLIRTTHSLISPGTERMLVEFGQASYLEKARQNPERVRTVIDKVKTDGLAQTIDAVRSKLAQPLPLGYCNVGVVQDLGRGVSEFKAGDRVVSNGAHSEIVRVPKNLCAKIPDGVRDDAAAFTVIASIGLQGIRLAQPTLGESFVVTGAGLIGLLTVQLLRAHGCRVLAIDFDDGKLELARSFGAETCNPGRGEDPVSAGLAFSRGQGIDGVIITASTASNDPVSQAARMCRQRGRIVLVGVVGLELNRAEFYTKELSFQVSCSYGPGRYDPAYEDAGNDYPLGFVRWTEQRNFTAILDMMASGQLNVAPLISKRFPFDQATSAYGLLTTDKSAIGIMLDYDAEKTNPGIKTVALRTATAFKSSQPVVGFIGAGNYASRVLIPAFKAAGAQLKSVVTSAGVSGVVHGRSAGFAEATTDVDALLNDAEINTIAIVTRHNSHARFTAQALNADKNVFVEKPLALETDELDAIAAAWRAKNETGRGPQLMVGFNRRFAPHVEKMKSLLDTVSEPKSFIMTMNVGAIPAESWVQNDEVGGGRIAGEACHFIDLMRFLTGSPITSVQGRRMGSVPNIAIPDDKATITLGFADGSFGTIHYLANGHASFPKERIEVFCAGRILQLDNFRILRGYGWPSFKTMRLWRQDKGQKQCAAAFLQALAAGKPSPIPFDELIDVARATIDAADLLRRQT